LSAYRPTRWLFSVTTLDRAVDAIAFSFALWTMCCHATVLTHGNGWRLFQIAGVTFGLLGALIVARLVGAGRRRAPAERQPEQSSPPVPLRTAVEPVSLVGLAFALVTLCAWWLRPDGQWFWLAGIAFMLVSAALLGARPLDGEHAEDVRPWQLAVLLALGVLGGIVTACMSLPNSDDVLYVNIAVSLADEPSYVLYARDTIHGGDVTLLAPYYYSVDSFELLAGLITRLTKIPAVAVMQLGFGPLAGCLAPIAWARLLRRIEPSRWLWLTAIIVSLYLFDGGSERSIVGHAFVRLFQGKAVLLTVLVPLLSAYAIEYAERPTSRRWLMLAASVISGTGLSSTGLWLAPAVAGTALLVPLTWRKSWWKGMALGLLTCLYPVALGLQARSQMVSRGTVSAFGELPLGDGKVGDYWGMLRETFIGSRATVAYIVCVLVAWPLARSVLARRYLVAFSLVGVLIFLNPPLNPFVMAYVTGAATHGRLLWYLPFTVAFAICFGAPIAAEGGPARRLWGLAATVAALIAFYATVPTQTALALAPLEFPPRLKVYHAGYEVARYLADHVSRGTFVLAPAGVSLALPMVQHHPYPIMTKPKFFPSGGDGNRRFRLRRLVDGKITPILGPRRIWVLKSITEYKIGAVVLTSVAERVPGLTETLQIAGFRDVHEQGDFRVWLRAR
jgi:MFS family permease